MFNRVYKLGFWSRLLEIILNRCDQCNAKRRLSQCWYCESKLCQGCFRRKHLTRFIREGRCV
jgi:plasmid rolling circle replication initiator protein Rep